MPGHCGHCVRSGLLYARRDTLLPIFASQVPFPVQEVYVAIRNYADFFASSYVEYLRSARGDKVVLEDEMKRKVVSRVPSWTEYLTLVQSCFPNARLMIWCHEDFSILKNKIIGSICSALNPSELAVPKRKQERPSASHRAVQELHDLIQTHGSAKALTQRVEIQERYPRGDQYPGYDPWSIQERKHLTRLYERDVEQIKAMDGVIVLEPEMNKQNLSLAKHHN